MGTREESICIACGCHRRTFFGESCVWDEKACAGVWRTFAFLHNQQRAGGCFHTTWSLAVQMRFYALFPPALLLLRPRAPGFRCRPCCMKPSCTKPHANPSPDQRELLHQRI